MSHRFLPDLQPATRFCSVCNNWIVWDEITGYGECQPQEPVGPSDFERGKSAMEQILAADKDNLFNPLAILDAACVLAELMRDGRLALFDPQA